MVVKRRVIWMDDADWKWMQDEAAAQGMTVSAHIRAATAIAGPMDPSTKALFGPDVSGEGPQALRAVLATERFNTQPFRGPIPKSGKR